MLEYGWGKYHHDDSQIKERDNLISLNLKLSLAFQTESNRVCVAMLLYLKKVRDLQGLRPKMVQDSHLLAPKDGDVEIQDNHSCLKLCDHGHGKLWLANHGTCKTTHNS